MIVSYVDCENVEQGFKNFEKGQEPDGWVKVVGFTSVGAGKPSRYSIEKYTGEGVVLRVHLEPTDKTEFLYYRLYEGFVYGGYAYQFDEKARLNITGKALRLQLDDVDSTTYWRTMDNQMVSFTKSEFIEFAKAVSDYYEQCFMESLTAIQ